LNEIGDVKMAEDKSPFGYYDSYEPIKKIKIVKSTINNINGSFWVKVPQPKQFHGWKKN